jgi:hypothetical protein
VPLAIKRSVLKKALECPVKLKTFCRCHQTLMRIDIKKTKLIAITILICAFITMHCYKGIV